MRLRFGAWVRIEPLDCPDEVRLVLDPSQIVVERHRTLQPKAKAALLRRVRKGFKL